MAAVITGAPIVDAIENMKIHLETAIDSWEVTKVHRYDSSEVGKRGNHIAIAFAGWTFEPTGFGGLTIVGRHKVRLNIFYVHATNTRIDVTFNKIYERLSEIALFLLENPRPNGYGELLVEDQLFGFDAKAITAIPTEAGNFLSGYFEVAHTLEGSTHNLTLAP